MLLTGVAATAFGVNAARAADPPPRSDDEFVRAFEELREEYAAQLAELAAWCDSRNLAQQAQTTRRWFAPRDPDKIYVTDLSAAMLRSKPAADVPADVAEWESRFLKLRQQAAVALEQLARRAVRARRASLAMDMVLAGLRENPDQESLRRVLGFLKYRNEWRTPWEITRLQRGQFFHEKFGWIGKNEAARYAKGLRPSEDGWISAEEDAKRHSTIENGWLVETEHYRIRTNHSIEGGVALAEKLERFYRVWRQLFFRYFASEEQLAEAFDPRSRRLRLPSPQFQVSYFRNRRQYNEHLRPHSPGIENTIGAYFEGSRTAYFFADGEYAEPNTYHEATHQLFQESRLKVAPDVGARGNFWIIEGIAMYMETFHREGSFWVLGGHDGPRMEAARFRLIDDDFYIPLEKFSAITMRQLQDDRRRPMLYTQAAGLMHFLMQHDRGRYRDALVGALGAIYSGQDNPGTFARLAETNSDELDRQYKEYIKRLPPPAEKAPPAAKSTTEPGGNAADAKASGLKSVSGP